MRDGVAAFIYIYTYDAHSTRRVATEHRHDFVYSPIFPLRYHILIEIFERFQRITASTLWSISPWHLHKHRCTIRRTMLCFLSKSLDLITRNAMGHNDL